MRRLLLLMVLPMFLMGGTISYSLRQKLEKASPQDMFTVVVEMVEQFDAWAVRNRMTEEGRTFAEFHKAVIDGLRETARRTQKNVIKIAKAGKAKGKVSWYKPMWIANYVKLTATRDIIEQIAALPEVYLVREFVPPKLIRPVKIGGYDPTKIDPTQPVWHIRHIHAPELWNMGYRGKMVKVTNGGDGSGRAASWDRVLLATLDSGVDAFHPALYWKWKHYLVYGDTLWHAASDTQYFYYPGGATAEEKWLPRDPGPTDFTHGTHVTGTMVGMEEDGTHPVGVAPEAMWIGCRASQGPGDLNYMDDCQQWVADPDGNSSTIDDVPVAANNSYGYSSSSRCVTQDDDRIKNAEAAGVAMIFAIGNDGPDASTACSPGQNNYTDYSVFSVGAVVQHYENGQEADTACKFSSRGPSDCNQGGEDTKPEVCAPGAEVISCMGREWSGRGMQQYWYETGWGTSMATPHVTGAYGLLYSIFGDTLEKMYGVACMDTIKKALMVTAKDKGDAGNDNTYGWGMIDLVRAWEWLRNKIYGDGGTKIAVADYNVEDLTTIASSNDGDTIPEPGETLDVYIGLYQPIGTSVDLTNVDASLIPGEDENYVKVINGGPVSYGTITHGAADTVWNSSAPFRIWLSVYTPPLYGARMRIAITSDQGNDTCTFILQTCHQHIIATLDFTNDNYPNPSGIAFDDVNDYLYVFRVNFSDKTWGGDYYDVADPKNPSRIGALSYSQDRYPMGAEFWPGTDTLWVTGGDSLYKYTVSGGDLTRLTALYVEATVYAARAGRDGTEVKRIRGVDAGPTITSSGYPDYSNFRLYAWWHDYYSGDSNGEDDDPDSIGAAVPALDRVPPVAETLGYHGPNGQLRYDSYLIEADSAWFMPNGRGLAWDGRAWWTTYGSGAEAVGGATWMSVVRRGFQPDRYLEPFQEFWPPSQDVKEPDSCLLYDNAWQPPYYLWQADWNQFKVWCFDVEPLVAPRPPVPVTDKITRTGSQTACTLHWHQRPWWEFTDSIVIYREAVSKGKNTGVPPRKAYTRVGVVVAPNEYTLPDTYFIDTGLDFNNYDYYYAFKAYNIYTSSPFSSPESYVLVTLATYLTNFYGISTPAGVKLTWSASNSDVDAWVLEKRNGDDWTRLARIEPSRITRPNTYEYLDVDVRTGETYTYRVGMVKDGKVEYLATTSVEHRVGAPAEFALLGASPNPFHNATSVRFGVPYRAHVKVEVFNVMGRKVKTLVDGELEPGYHVVRWDGTSESGRRVASGIYIFRMTAPDYEGRLKTVYLR